MARERICYGLFILGIGALLFCFGSPFLFYILLLLILLPLCGNLLLYYDARRISVSLSLPTGYRRGKKQPLCFEVRHRGHLLVAQGVEAELRLRWRSFDREYTEHIRFALGAGQERISFTVPAAHSGVLEVECLGLRVRDLLQLFAQRLPDFPRQEVLVLPAALRLSVSLYRDDPGESREEGELQNRRGADFSEPFDLRSYQPGDDLRGIHWKLSGKLDELILREPGDPAHFDVAVLPDLGRLREGEAVSEAALEAARSYAEALGAALLRQQVSFCLLLPSARGISLQEVRDIRTFRQQLLCWLSQPIPWESGTGLRYFLLEHLQSRFSGLLVLSAGGCSRELTSLSEQLGVTVLNAETDRDSVSAEKLGSKAVLLRLPVQQEAEKEYRIRVTV